MQIKEILTIDLSEDIKNVIDLEDLSEAEIQNEIGSYIVTDGLAKEYADFVSIYTSARRRASRPTSSITNGPATASSASNRSTSASASRSSNTGRSSCRA
jgi:hypothetical protein